MSKANSARSLTIVAGALGAADLVAGVAGCVRAPSGEENEESVSATEDLMR
jgi:hypothetical protein